MIIPSCSKLRHLLLGLLSDISPPLGVTSTCQKRILPMEFRFKRVLKPCPQNGFLFELTAASLSLLILVCIPETYIFLLFLTSSFLLFCFSSKDIYLSYYLQSWLLLSIIFLEELKYFRFSRASRSAYNNVIMPLHHLPSPLFAICYSRLLSQQFPN